MNQHEAKEILVLFRPGTADASDPSFTEALQSCQRDPELKRWFDDHCAVYTTLREKFKQTPIPEGLKEQILAERKIHTLPLWRQPAVLAAAAAFLVVAALGSVWLRSRLATGSAAFVDRMISTALRDYAMYVTNNHAEVRAYLARYQAPADYALPASLEKTAATGCAVENWQGNMVSILCFSSGKLHAPGRTTDLWLFVADRKAAPGAPATDTPVLAQRNRVTTARWSAGNRTYLLVADGDEDFIRKYL